MRIIRARTLGITLAIGILAATGLDLPMSRVQIEEETARSGLRLVVNTTARRLHVYENGKRTKTYRVAVGKPGHRTPSGSYTISRAIWNPSWVPPDSEWARGKKPQGPGPNNPMGKVKLYFRNLYYIHGTPDTGSLGQAASHGCIRMSNKEVVELARLIHSYSTPRVSESEIDALARSRRTRTIAMQRRVPLQVTASRAEVHDGKLEIFASEERASTARVREEAMQALREAGFDLSALHRARLDDLIRRGRQRDASIELEKLRLDAPAVADGADES